MTELKIKFETKFIQKDLETYLNKFWSESFEVKNITFDLSITEWVSSEQVTFLFSWIIKLKQTDKKVKVILPFSQLYEGETDENRDRRRFLKYYLLRVWGMFDRLGLRDLDFENIENYNNSIKENENFNFGKKIIPFQRIPVEFTDYANEKVDEKYSLIKSPESGVFSLGDEIINFLNENECYSPFENKVISDIITKELVINSMEHTSERESFFTTALNDKWASNKGQYFIDHYKKERDSDTLDFYKDKTLIKKKIQHQLTNLNSKQLSKLEDIYYPSLEKFDDFKNQSFVEFTYIDYGPGVFATLAEQFSVFKEESDFKNVSKGFNERNKHTQILEYAFLLESSKEPFNDEETRYNELIPRGLYFIVDMVRRYKGLLIARSGEGKIIYDFSNRLKIKKVNEKEYKVETERIYVAKDSVIPITTNDSFFPGLMISIILPQRKSIDFKKSSVRIDSEKLNKTIFNRDNADYYPAQIYEPQSYEFLNLAFEYQKSEEESSLKAFNTRTGIIKLVFRSISNKLSELNGKNCVLFIDFEFIPMKDNNDILKILLYLSNNPMVNERTKVIVLNIEKNDLDKLKEYQVSNFGDNESDNSNFLFKPIPCLRINKNSLQKAEVSDIQWIGVHNPEDLQILTNLFFGNIEFNKGITIESTTNEWLYEGNIITKHNDRAYSIFTNFQDVIDKAKDRKTKQLEKWLLDQVIDGSKPKPGENKFHFLTSKGSYQRKYLSLYESLNYKYTARYFAQYLLDKYLDTYIARNPNDYEEQAKFNKIIVVTVSSQLLGVEIINLIKDNNTYYFLRNEDYLKNGSGNNPKIKDCPKLIKLASYFSFDSEKPFEDIKENDKVLIVNDVISTGSLLKRLKEGIEIRNALISGVISIADSRKEDDKIDESDEYKSHFFDELEDFNVSVLSHKNNNNFNLEKRIRKPKDVKLVKRINPILNAVVGLESEHTEIIKILYKDPEELITQRPFKNDIFSIGHFKQNITHNSYFTNMHNLFFDKNGEELLIILKNKIDEQYPKIRLNNNDFLYSYFNNLKASTKDPKVIDAIDLIIEDSKEQEYTNKYKPKFIFYPVYSGIEEVSEDTLHSIFGTDKNNIVSLQRYETKNGWRFPFPAKRFNLPTKGAHILIIDSGALSGHSLVQLIDSISFLDVGRIDFLSIVGRIDDFQREFYSRLRTIKVKNFRNGADKRKNSIVDLNIMFGINLHIPSSISAESCPYCAEIKKLEGYLEDHLEKLPEQTIKYIKNRIYEEIPLIEDSIKFKFPKYIPTLKNENQPDFIQIFNTRDKLGKVDSYRFYIEYFEYFDKIGNQIDANNISALFDESNDDLLVQIELILICVLHEPHLVNVLKDLLASIYEISISLLDAIIFDSSLIKNLNYIWGRYAIVKLSYSLKSQNKLVLNEFYHYQNFEKIYKFSNDCEYSLNFLSYLLTGSYYNLKGDEFCTRDRIKPILDYLKNDYPGKETYGSRVLNEIIRKYEANSVTSVKTAVYNLNWFFTSEEAKEGHTIIQDRLSKLRKISFEDSIEVDSKIIFEHSTFIIDKLELLLFQNLNFLYQKKETNEWCGKYYDLLFGSEKIYKVLKKLILNFKKIRSNYSNVTKQELLSFSKELILFNFNFLFQKDDNDFFRFCDSYRTLINQTIRDYFQDNRQYYKNIEIKLNLSERDNFISIPKVFLEMCLQEVFNNASQKSNRTPSKLTIVISTEEISSNSLEFKIHQNASFDQTKKIGGFHKIIKPILSSFGDDKSFAIIDNNEFTFKTNFNLC